jgi:predicted 3-demethylubiquinone-9 3-methyltransferase (glyoxalase superfamily)
MLKAPCNHCATSFLFNKLISINQKFKAMTQSIYPCLWFDGQAKEAAEFYCTVFPDTHITADTFMVVNFEASGQRFMCLNGGPSFTINPSISFFVVYESEEELDAAWHQLMNGGSALMPLDKYDWSKKYGWVQDRFGVNWQLSFGKLEEVGQRFTPVLMFTGNQQGRAEEAIGFYTGLFQPSQVVGILRYVKGEPDIEGTVKHAQFKLGDGVMMAMDSSYPHQFGFNEAVSLVVECKDQREIDHYWNAFTQQGQAGKCGWLKDQFGVSWQIIPANLGQLMTAPGKGDRAIQALMQMQKLEIEKLENA